MKLFITDMIGFYQIWLFCLSKIGSKKLTSEMLLEDGSVLNLVFKLGCIDFESFEEPSHILINILLFNFLLDVNGRISSLTIFEHCKKEAVSCCLQLYLSNTGINFKLFVELWVYI